MIPLSPPHCSTMHGLQASQVKLLKGNQPLGAHPYNTGTTKNVIANRADSPSVCPVSKAVFTRDSKPGLASV
jgi:hypothetical protein